MIYIILTFRLHQSLDYFVQLKLLQLPQLVYPDWFWLAWLIYQHSISNSIDIPEWTRLLSFSSTYIAAYSYPTYETDWDCKRNYGIDHYQWSQILCRFICCEIENPCTILSTISILVGVDGDILVVITAVIESKVKKFVTNKQQRTITSTSGRWWYSCSTATRRVSIGNIIDGRWHSWNSVTMSHSTGSTNNVTRSYWIIIIT